MDDLISRQAAIDAVCEDGTQLERQGQYSMTMAERKQRDVDILEAQPTVDAVPVVRCRDCEYWDTIPRSTVAPLHHQCKETRLITTGIWYCPLGKRKDGGNHEG